MKSDETPPKTTNDKILKEVQPKEVTSLVEVSRNAQSAAGNSLRKVQQNFETLGTEIQFTRICKEATFIHDRTTSDVDDGFGDRTPVCRKYTRPTAESDSRIFTAFKNRTIIGPVLQVHNIVSLHFWN